MSDLANRSGAPLPASGRDAAGDPGTTPKGWYPDPVGRADLRWWSGESWTAWTVHGDSVLVDPLVDRRTLTTQDLGHLAFVEFVFLPELALRAGLTPAEERTAGELLRDLVCESRWQDVPAAPGVTGGDLVGEPTARQLTPDASGAPVPWAATPAVAAAPSSAPTTLAPPVGAGAEPRPPGPLSRWWGRTWESVGSDLAVHGLAYLGVLLFFVGVFGLVAFAFGDVERSLRPVAEVIIAGAPFAAAALLLRRDAVIVGRALEVVGGLLLPVMLITSFLDGMAVPPDLTGSGLVLALTLACLGIAAGYALWARRHPASGLRFVVAPMLWFAAAMASLGLGRPIPSGEGVAVPATEQVAVTLVVLFLTVAWARWRPAHPLAGPTLGAAVPGFLVLGLLAILTWSASEAPAVPAVLVSGLVGVATLELLARRPERPPVGPEPGPEVADEPVAPPTTLAGIPPAPLGPGVVGLVEPVWWALTTAALAAGLGGPWAACLAVLGSLAVLELAARARRPGWALAVPAALAAVALPITSGLPWVQVAVLTLASVWAIWRRRTPFAARHAPGLLDLAAALLPVGTVLALGAAAALPVALAAAAVVVLLATVPATRPVLDRGPDDRFWSRWWLAAFVLVALATASVWALVLGADWRPAATLAVDQWLVIGSVVALGVAVVLGPIPALVRPWLLGALGSWAWILACVVASIPDAVRGAVPAGIALGVVVAVHVRRSAAAALAGSIGLAAHALGLGAIGLGGLDWGLLTTVVLATAGMAVTSAFDARDRSPIGDGLSLLYGPLRQAPVLLTAVGLPLSVLIGLDASGATTWTSASTAAVLALAAVAYAGATRVIGVPRIDTTLAWTAFAAGLGATAAGGSGWPLAAGLASVMAVVALLRPARRAGPMVWTAWAALAPLVVTLLTESWTTFAAQPEGVRASTGLIGVGGAMLVAATSVDLRFGPWAPRWRPRRAALLPVAAIGAAEVVLGSLVALGSSSGGTLGWQLVAASAVALATAVLARIGLLGGVAVVVAWAGAALLVGPDAEVPAWVGVGAAAVLIGASELSRRVVPDRDWWSRWDVPLLVAAAPVALTAMGASTDRPAEAPTTVAVGIEVLVVAGLWRRVRAVPVLLVPVGSGLVLFGAATAGGLWLALALAVLSVVTTVAAALSAGGARVVLQLTGAMAAAAAWLAVLGAVEWPAQAALDTTAVGAGVIAVLGAGVAWTRRVDRPWILAWSGTAVGIVGCAGVLALGGVADVALTSAVVLALALVAVALLASAVPLRIEWLRDLGVVATLAAVVAGMDVWQATAPVQVVVLAGISVVSAVLLMVARGRMPGWQRTVVELGVVTAGAALAVAASSSDPGLLAPALAVAAVQAAACGAVLGMLWVQVLAPLLACASWLVFTSEALPDDPQWWSMPVGLALLVVVGLWRRDRAHEGLPLASPQVVAVELAGLGFLVGAWMVQAVVSSVAYALPLMVMGVLIAGWGLVTRVRRRVGIGVAVVLTAVVLVVAVPLVQLLPSWGSAGLWILVAVVGVVAVLIATLLEEGRAAVRTSLGRFRDATAEWE